LYVVLQLAMTPLGNFSCHEMLSSMSLNFTGSLLVATAETETGSSPDK